MASGRPKNYLRGGVLAVIFAGASALAAAEAGRLEQAVEARLDGRFDEAGALLEAETAEAPGNADAWLQLGLVRSSQGYFDAAREAFLRTLEIEPDYLDAEIALARIDWFQGRDEAALGRLSALEQTPEVTALAARIKDGGEPEGSPLWRATIGAGYSDLTRGLPGWSEVSGAITRRTTSGPSYTFLVDYAERFDRSDVYLEGRADTQLSNRLAGYLAAGGTPEAIFRPKLSLSGGLATDIGATDTARDPLRVSADLRYAEYVSGSVQSGKFGIAKPFEDNRFLLGASLILLSDEQGEGRQGYAVTSEWQAAAASRLFLVYADAPETSDGITLDVQSAVLGWRQALNERQSFQLNLVHERRTVYDRTGVFVSTSVSF